MRRIVFFIVLSLLSVANASAQEYVWPPFPTPDKAEVSWVAEQMIYNNVPEQIRIMESKLSPQDVVVFYQQLWTKDKHPVAGNVYEPGTVTLSTMQGPFLFTAQIHGVKPEGSESILTVSRMPEVIQQRIDDKKKGTHVLKKLGDGFPMLAGSRVMVDMQCFDIGKQNRMIIHHNGSSVEDNALYIREQLILQGWARTENHIEKDGARALVFRRAHDELTVTLRTNGDKTEIVSNQVELH